MLVSAVSQLHSAGFLKEREAERSNDAVVVFLPLTNYSVDSD